MPQPKPLLLTGAAGRLAGWLRPHLAKRPGGVRSTDVRPYGPAHAGEEIVQADLADAAAVDRLVDGVEAVVHFGGIRLEDSFDRILQANIIGTYNVFDAARRMGVNRIVYASSVHAIGYYESTRTIDADVPHRPDSYYGLSKAFGEDLGRFYADKAGMDIACLRIGTVYDEPKNARMLFTMLSHADMLHLVEVCLTTPRMGFAVIYANSNNTHTWWDNSKCGVDYRPQASSGQFAHKFTPADIANTTDPARAFQGGHFIPLDFGESPPA